MMIPEEMTPEEFEELAKLLEGTAAHLRKDEGGFIVEFDNGQGFRGAMHPRAALEMFREPMTQPRQWLQDFLNSQEFFFSTLSTKRANSGRFILDANGEPHEEPDLMVWATWFETADKRVAFDVVNGLEVSTIFLGINYRMVGNGPPLLWETMVFNADKPLHQTRYTRRADAEAGHKAIVERVKNGEFNVKQDG